MPHLDQILIHPHDMQNIMEALISHQYSGPIIIIDKKLTWTIRDIDYHFITEVKKCTHEPNHQA